MSVVKAEGPRSHWKGITHAPAGAVPVDTVTVVNTTRVTFAAADVEAGENGEFIYEATDVEVAKDATVTIVEGDKAYYHTTNDNFTNVATGAVECGVFRQAQALSDTTARIDMHVV
ncbi:MAG: DUF2190 family protein [Gammaproteobacteria bacterium]|nr:DUF2190 family protein [Gammaproteobacteria bacterium]